MSGMKASPGQAFKAGLRNALAKTKERINIPIAGFGSPKPVQEEIAATAEEPEPEEIIPAGPSKRDILDSLDSGFFTEDFDGLRYVLSNLPEEDFIWSEFLQAQEESYLGKLEVVSSSVNERVMANYNDFVQGMAFVSELQEDLQLSNIVVKNGRRSLKKAATEVAANLRVKDLTRKKDCLAEVLERAQLLQELHKLEGAMKKTLQEQDFASAIHQYVESSQIIMQVQDLQVVAELQSKMEELLTSLIERLNDRIQLACQQFEEESYVECFNAYRLLHSIESDSLDIKPLEEKLQECFSTAVERETDGVLLAYALTMDSDMDFMDGAGGANRKGRIQYKEMCRHLSAEHFFPCLSKTLEILFDLLRSHYRTMQWHQRQAAAHPKSEPAAGHQNPDTETPEARIDAAEGEVYARVAAALEQNSRMMWEMAAMRVGSLLNAPCGPHSSMFYDVLKMLHKFVATGEAFTGQESMGLRNQISKMSAKFFEALHNRHLEVLRMMLDKEMWVRLPQEAIPPARLALRRALRLRPLDGCSRDNAQPFSAYMASNPFSDAEREEEDGEEEEADERSCRGEVPGQEDDEEEEDEELHGEYIDEESQEVDGGANADGIGLSARSGRARKPQWTAGQGAGLSAENPTVTTASLHVLRCLADYIRLSHVLGDANHLVFMAICTMFESALLFTFRTFGNQGALENQVGAGGEQLTPRLRGTITRLRTQSRAGAVFAQPSPGPTGGAVGGTENAAYTSSGNLYGLKERCVAAESLGAVAEELKRARSTMESQLGAQNGRAVEHFFSRTVDVVEDLREHMYKTVARLLLSIDWMEEEIGDSEKLGATKKYDRREVGMQHTQWVDRLLAEFRQFGMKLKCAEVPVTVTQLLWEYSTEACAEKMVEGLSRVRKCSAEGRACMTLDLQVIVSALKGHQQQLGGVREPPNMRLVDTYIKAFYVPEGELLHWAQTHPEYTLPQIISLVNQIAGANNWARRTRADLIAQIEAGATH